MVYRLQGSAVTHADSITNIYQVGIAYPLDTTHYTRRTYRNHAFFKFYYYFSKKPGNPHK
nr:MAG TPA: hypothetical protein [Caudoviricetes sp.]